MGSEYLFNTDLFDVKVENTATTANQLEISDAAFDNQAEALGDLESVTLLAKQQEYLVDMSNTYKKRYVDGIVFEFNSVSTRAKNATSSINNWLLPDLGSGN